MTNPTTGPAAMPSHLELYRHIIATIEREGRRPTFREIMTHYGFSGTNAVSTHIKTLEKHGYVKRKVFPHGCSDTFDILRLPDGSEFGGFRAVRKTPTRPRDGGGGSAEGEHTDAQSLLSR